MTRSPEYRLYEMGAPNYDNSRFVYGITNLFVFAASMYQFWTLFPKNPCLIRQFHDAVSTADVQRAMRYGNVIMKDKPGGSEATTAVGFLRSWQ
jgi:hypothetical protein